MTAAEDQRLARSAALFALAPDHAVAATRARVLAAPRRALREAVLAEPKTALAVVAAAYRQMRGLLGQIRQLKARTATERLARFLADLAPPDAESAAIELPYEKALIAARLGVTPSTLSRAFRQLAPIGVRIANDEAVIDDVAALRAFGRSDGWRRRNFLRRKGTFYTEIAVDRSSGRNGPLMTPG